MSDLKGMTCSIFGDKRLGNCSNRGISSRFDQVVVTGVVASNGHEYADVLDAVDRANKVIENEMRIFSAKPEGDPYAAAEVELVLRRLHGRRLYVHARPVGQSGRWEMFGGTYIDTSDSRWNQLIRTINHDGHDYQVGPIPLHDRYES